MQINGQRSLESEQGAKAFYANEWNLNCDMLQKRSKDADSKRITYLSALN
jgi:hypothetical protein